MLVNRTTVSVTHSELKVATARPGSRRPIPVNDLEQLYVERVAPQQEHHHGAFQGDG